MPPAALPTLHSTRSAAFYALFVRTCRLASVAVSHSTAHHASFVIPTLPAKPHALWQTIAPFSFSPAGHLTHPPQRAHLLQAAGLLCAPSPVIAIFQFVGATAPPAIACFVVGASPKHRLHSTERQCSALLSSACLPATPRAYCPTLATVCGAAFCMCGHPANPEPEGIRRVATETRDEPQSF